MSKYNDFASLKPYLLPKIKYNDRRHLIKIDMCFMLVHIISQTYFEWTSIKLFLRDVLSLQNYNTSRYFATLIKTTLGENVWQERFKTYCNFCLWNIIFFKVNAPPSGFALYWRSWRWCWNSCGDCGLYRKIICIVFYGVYSNFVSISIT